MLVFFFVPGFCTSEIQSVSQVATYETNQSLSPPWNPPPSCNQRWSPPAFIERASDFIRWLETLFLLRQFFAPWKLKYAQTRLNNNSKKKKKSASLQRCKLFEKVFRVCSYPLLFFLQDMGIWKTFSTLPRFETVGARVSLSLLRERLFDLFSREKEPFGRKEGENQNLILLVRAATGLCSKSWWSCPFLSYCTRLWSVKSKIV